MCIDLQLIQFNIQGGVFSCLSILGERWVWGEENGLEMGRFGKKMVNCQKTLTLFGELSILFGSAVCLESDNFEYYELFGDFLWLRNWYENLLTQGYISVTV